MFTAVLIAYYTNKLDSIIGKRDCMACLFHLNIPLFLFCPHRGAFAQNLGPRVVFHYRVSEAQFFVFLEGQKSIGYCSPHFTLYGTEWASNKIKMK